MGFPIRSALGCKKKVLYRVDAGAGRSSRELIMIVMPTIQWYILFQTEFRKKTYSISDRNPSATGTREIFITIVYHSLPHGFPFLLSSDYLEGAGMGVRV
jgi:hypothetical protein